MIVQWYGNFTPTGLLSQSMNAIRFLVLYCGTVIRLHSEAKWKRPLPYFMNPAEFAAYLIPKKDKIFRFARAILSDVSEAEDATQDIFEKLWREQDRLQDIKNLDAFIMVSVRNLCYDRLRRRKLQTSKLDEVKAQSATAVVGFSPDTLDIRAVLLRVMEALPPKQRAILHLRDVEGYDIDEIASIVEMGEPSVRVLLSRARQSVRVRLIEIMEYGTK